MRYNNLIKKYALSAVHYILNNIDDEVFSSINQIILFGSSARGTADKDSDIDLFFDADKKNKRVITKKINEFYTSREGLLFKIKGISNIFQVIVGKLDEWKELHRSIASEGIILYGQYISSPKKESLKHYFIISWENLDIKNRGAFLNKMYGYVSSGKRYKGILKKWNFKKIGKSTVLVPIEHKKNFLSLLSKYKVDYKIIDVYL